MFFFFQAEDGIRDVAVTGVQTCALPICPGRRTGLVLVIAERGVGVRLVPAPGRVVAAHIRAERTIGERVVAEGEDGARDGVEDPRRQLVAVDTAARDVAGREQHGAGLRRHKRRRDHGSTARAARACTTHAAGFLQVSAIAVGPWLQHPYRLDDGVKRARYGTAATVSSVGPCLMWRAATSSGATPLSVDACDRELRAVEDEMKGAAWGAAAATAVSLACLDAGWPVPAR